MNNPTIKEQYAELFQAAVSEIESARLHLARQINTSAMQVYWNLGKLLVERKIEKGHGAGVVNQLSADLKKEFPDMGLSPRNLWDMKRFYERYSQSDPKLRQLVAVLPWGHNLLLLAKVKEDEHIEFYANEALTKGWSRDLLLNAIKMDSSRGAQNGVQTNNFAQTLPQAHAEYANEVFKSAYNLGFLGVTQPVKETELENRLIAKIRDFVLELGKGFSFIGNQYRYGFNGKENDGETAWQDYGERIYSPRIAKFLSVDPLTKQYPELTPYQFASNTPIWAIDLDGLEAFFVTGTTSDNTRWFYPNGKKTVDRTLVKGLFLLTRNTKVSVGFNWNRLVRGMSNNDNIFSDGKRPLNYLHNNKHDRHIAAQDLVTHVMNYRKVHGIDKYDDKGSLVELGNEPVTFIGHSHGGNVSILR